MDRYRRKTFGDFIYNLVVYIPKLARSVYHNFPSRRSFNVPFGERRERECEDYRSKMSHLLDSICNSR